MTEKYLPKYAVPYRPAISDILVKASANINFRFKLLQTPFELLNDMDIPVEDVEILMNIYAPTLNDFAHQLKNRLTNARQNLGESTGWL